MINDRLKWTNKKIKQNQRGLKKKIDYYVNYIEQLSTISIRIQGIYLRDRMSLSEKLHSENTRIWNALDGLTDFPHFHICHIRTSTLVIESSARNGCIGTLSMTQPLPARVQY